MRTVLQTWREREAAFKKLSIALLLTTDAPAETAHNSLAEAIAEVMESHHAKKGGFLPRIWIRITREEGVPDRR